MQAIFQLCKPLLALTAIFKYKIQKAEQLSDLFSKSVRIVTKTKGIILQLPKHGVI